MTAYVFLANGFEDIEALAPVDILRRGGVNVRTVSIYNSPVVTSAHNVDFHTDITLPQVLRKQEDILIFPGGMPGSTNLAQCGAVADLLKAHWAENGLTAAICAAPAVVLAGILGNALEGRNLTCYPGFEAALSTAGARATRERVTCDGNLITGKGPGTALEFGVAILESLKGAEQALEVKNGMLM